MSPRIGLELSLAESISAQPPRFKVLAALALARSAGVNLIQGEPGVTRGRFAGDWTADRSRAPRGCSVVGAILVILQAAPLEDETAEGTAARALGVPPAWVEGLADGWNQLPQADYWRTDLYGDNYLDGYFVGVEALCLSSMFCQEPGCGKRRFKADPICTCARGRRRR